jgi:hypothetical protein
MLQKLVASFIGHLKPDRVAERSKEKLELVPPNRRGGVPLMEALSRRRSTHEFQTTALPPGSQTVGYPA